MGHRSCVVCGRGKDLGCCRDRGGKLRRVEGDMTCLMLEKDHSGGVKREHINTGGHRAVRRSRVHAGRAQGQVLSPAVF